MLPLQSELVVEASNEAEKLSDLMADLIEVAELDTGKRELQLERLRPLPLLDEARNRYVDEAASKAGAHRSQAPSRICRLSWPIAAQFAQFSTTWWQMRLRYTPPDGEILLAAEEIKNFVQFTVRDSGRGIEADRLSNIFDRFNPFSESGTGMGLALVRRLVESLGGQIAVESRLGHGTTFRFTLPVAVAEAIPHPVEVG